MTAYEKSQAVKVIKDSLGWPYSKISVLFGISIARARELYIGKNWNSRKKTWEDIKP